MEVLAPMAAATEAQPGHPTTAGHPVEPSSRRDRRILSVGEGRGDGVRVYRYLFHDAEEDFTSITELIRDWLIERASRPGVSL